MTYAYCLGARDLTPEQVFERDAEIARAHFATWSDQPIVVQQTISQLPATIEIPVPTPRGKQPVYPRMLFLRRELLTPGQSPLPVPAAPSVPQVGADEYLADVPNPWRIGTGKPLTADQRPTTARVFPAARVSYVSKGGETFSHRFIKWLKDDSDAWILLADFGLTELPEPKSLASAKLIVYVVEAHDRAPMQAAAVQLDAPFETGKPFDFAKLGRIAGTTVVAQGGGPDARFVPPRRYEIDVTGWCEPGPRGNRSTVWPCASSLTAASTTAGRCVSRRTRKNRSSWRSSRLRKLRLSRRLARSGPLGRMTDSELSILPNGAKECWQGMA